MKYSPGILFLFLLLIFGFSVVAMGFDQEGKLIEGRAIWANPAAVAYNDSVTRAFVQQCKRANIQLILLLVKFSDQRVFFRSQRLPVKMPPGMGDFDPLAAVIREAHRYGIRVHAWICSFTESTDGPVMQQHPEWAVRNREGKIPSRAEYLGNGRRYTINWMCPARRPGYVDQWLLPMIEEIVTNYEVDGIHHDYVRYPGDVAPDSYCFGDYCLEEMLRYAHFYYQAYPDSIFPMKDTLPNPLANWWSDPTVRPEGWEHWERKKKADFFLKGGFVRGGPSDMDYFFYTYRQDAITRFTREAWERASAIKPEIEFSAAVFKNPVVSGRFIGQRWTEFSPWVDVMMPMVYRSHFPDGSFDQFLQQLQEYTRYEYQWAQNRTHLYIGLDVHYIYDEERLFLSEGLKDLDSLKTVPTSAWPGYLGDLQTRYQKIRDHLGQVAPEIRNEIDQQLGKPARGIRETIPGLVDLLTRLNTNPPDDYYPKAKLRRAIETVRRAGSEGIVIFNASGLTSRKLWPVLEELFRVPSRPPEKVEPAAQMSIVTQKILQKKIRSLHRTVWILAGIGAILLSLWIVRLIKKSGRKKWSEV